MYPVIPLNAPSVVILRPVEVREKVPAAFPTATFPVPPVAIFTLDAPIVPKSV